MKVNMAITLKEGKYFSSSAFLRAIVEVHSSKLVMQASLSRYSLKADLFLVIIISIILCFKDSIHD